MLLHAAYGPVMSGLDFNYSICSRTFDVHMAVHRNIISIVNPTRCTNVSNLFYFGMTLYMFRTVHHYEFETVHTAAGICETDTAEHPLASRHPSPCRIRTRNLIERAAVDYAINRAVIGIGLILKLYRCL